MMKERGYSNEKTVDESWYVIVDCGEFDMPVSDRHTTEDGAILYKQKTQPLSDLELIVTNKVRWLTCDMIPDTICVKCWVDYPDPHNLNK